MELGKGALRLSRAASKHKQFKVHEESPQVPECGSPLPLLLETGRRK